MAFGKIEGLNVDVGEDVSDVNVRGKGQLHDPGRSIQGTRVLSAAVRVGGSNNRWSDAALPNNELIPGRLL